MFKSFHFYGIVFERHCINVFELWLQVAFNLRIERRFDNEFATFRRRANVAVFNDNFTTLEYITRVAEHLRDVLFFFINHDIRVRSDAQIAFLSQSKGACRTGGSDRGDFIKRVFTIDVGKRNAFTGNRA